MIADNHSQTLKAVDYFEPSAPPTQSADSYARGILRIVEEGTVVRASFVGFRSASSSYFNALLLTLRDSLGIDGVRRMVAFETESKAQRMILDKSIEAALGHAE